MFEAVGPHLQQWEEAFTLWLGSRRAENTRRNYRMAWQQLLQYTGKQPWEIRKSDLARWMSDMQAHGLAGSTIQLYLAAVSSFYRYVNQVYSIDGPDGEEMPLHPHNPAMSVQRPRVYAYAEAHCLSADQARALLESFDRQTLNGKRNYAMILMYLLTGRRNTEVRTLQWGDLETRDGIIWYRWAGKGKRGHNELPQVAYDALVDYLEAAGRLASMQRESYLFTGAHAETALSMRHVGQILKDAAMRAGLDPQIIHVHTLRHTAASLRMESGEDVKAIQGFLEHSSLNITGRYLHALIGRRDLSWQRVGNLLGVA
jgi:site-specific recombinase XerD